MKKNARALLYVAMTLSIMPSVWITSAYAMQINSIGIITPAGGFDMRAKNLVTEGMMIDTPVSADDFSGAVIKKKQKVVSNSATFMQRWLDTVGKNKTNLLWSSYPASIRGQIFGHQPAGNNPVTTGGW